MSTNSMTTRALSEAIAAGDIEAVRRLLAGGTDPVGERRRLRPGPVPLVEAVQAGRSQIVELLLGAGADPNGADRTGASPLKIAVHRDDGPAARLLLAHGADPARRGDPQSASPLQYAAYSGRVEMVRLFLEAGADADAVLQNGLASLLRIRGPILQMLIDAGGHAPPEILALLRDGAALP